MIRRWNIGYIALKRNFQVNSIKKIIIFEFHLVILPYRQLIIGLILNLIYYFLNSKNIDDTV